MSPDLSILYILLSFDKQYFIILLVPFIYPPRLFHCLQVTFYFCFNAINRKDYGLAVVAVIIVIFPGFIPVAGWLVRTVGVIAVLICLLAAYLSNFDYYNSESGGKIKEVGLKKFKRDETDINRILEAFLRKDFEYLAELPGAYSAPVQIHVEEDKLGQEMYCLLTSYDSDSNIIGLTNVLTLSGNDYLDHADVIRQMLKDAEND